MFLINVQTFCIDLSSCDGQTEQGTPYTIKHYKKIWQITCLFSILLLLLSMPISVSMVPVEVVRNLHSLNTT